MANEFNARVGQKKDTSANWTAANPVILDGEILIVKTESGEIRMKIGDGNKTYSQLPFSDEILRSLISERVLVAQGTNNAGMFLGVGSDGRVTPTAVSKTATWGELAGAS